MLTRKLAIGILANLYSHVELVHRWSSAPILLAFLKVIMNGVTKECQKLSSIITIFLARAADIFMKPGGPSFLSSTLPPPFLFCTLLWPAGQARAWHWP